MLQSIALPIEENKEFHFTASLSYKNPIDENIKYFTEFNFKIYQIISKDEEHKITTFNQRPDNLKKVWTIKVDDIRHSVNDPQKL